MNVKAMRTIDRFAGIPLCWIVGTLAHMLPSRQFNSAPRSILVMKFFGLGSILLSTPFLTTLRQRYPDASIIFVTFDRNAEIIKRLDQPDQRIIISTKSFVPFCQTVFRAILTIRKAKPDLVFDLEFFSKFSTFLSTISGSPARIGYQLPTRWRSLNITHPVPIDRSLHITRLFLEQLKPLGITIPENVSITRLTPTENESMLVSKTCDISDDEETIVVNIHAGPTSLERRWAPEQFVEVVRILAQEDHSRRFYFIGLQDERQYVESALSLLHDMQNRAVNCAGMLSFGELLALIHKAAFVLTNDSGPMHIASATGTPVVALFGPESPHFYGPVGKAAVVYKSLSCSPCLSVYNAKSFVCPYDARCMKEISTNEVLAAVRSILPVGRMNRSVA